MRSAISFKDRFGFVTCLNTDRIMTVEEYAGEGDGVSMITVDRNTQWVVKIPHDVIMAKITEAVNSANSTGEFVCVDLSS